MAEVNGRLPDEVANNRKVLPDTLGKTLTAVCELPDLHAAINIADTINFGIILKKGTRILCPVTVSNGAGTAASTLAVGLRDAVTKVPIDATAILAATAITAAQTVQASSGTRLVDGQRYVLPVDAEIYGTIAGAATPVNQRVRIEIPTIQA